MTADRTSVNFSEDTPRPIDQVILDMLGTGDNPRVGRPEALSVPGVLRGRNMLCSIATLPLEQRGPDRRVVRSPLLEQIDPNVPNVVTLSQTVEDLVFESISWWKITAFGWDGYPTSAMRVDPSLVSLQPPPGFPLRTLPSGEHAEGSVWINGKQVPASQVLRFDSPNPPVLAACGRSIRRAVVFERVATMYANNPRAQEYFAPTEGADPVDDDDVQEILDDWQRSRRTRSVGYVPASLKYNTVEMMSPVDLQLVELQKQAALDVANMLGLDPEDLGISTTSRTYQSAVDRRRDRINDVLAPYMKAITDRLGMGDVTKRGHTVGFNLDDYMKADPATRWDTYEKGLTNNVVSVGEVREFEGLPDVPVEPGPQRPAQPRQPVTEEAPAMSRTAVFSSETGATVSFEMDEATAAFRVNREKRTISGLLVPWDQVSGMANGAKWSFAKDSLTWVDDGHRVKLNREHARADTVGVAVRLQGTPAGLDGSFKIARGTAGDEVLSLAEDQILDGFSVEVDFEPGDFTEDDSGVLRVSKGVLRHVAITSSPAFDDARVTSVAASRGDSTMTAPQVTPAAGAPVTPEVKAPEAKAPETAEAKFSAAEMDGLKAMLAKFSPPGQPEGRQIVDPTKAPIPAAKFTVHEAAPYRFDGSKGTHDFSTDLFAGAKGDGEALKRAQDFVHEAFTAKFDVDTADVTGLNPTRNRPDMYVDQKAYITPFYDALRKGTLADQTPFTFPKFSSATGLVANHVQGTEPTPGTFVATTQTVTPGAMSGKVEITREVFDAGGNPQVSTLIWNKMVRAWFEELEAKAVAVLDAATPTQITLTTAAVNAALVNELEAAIADLQFVRGGNTFNFAGTHVDLYKRLAAAADTTGRKLLPIYGPTNANGQARSKFTSLDVAGVEFAPAWSLGPAGAVAESSYLVDTNDVHVWNTAPQRLEFQYRVAYVDLAIWGYSAAAISDLTGVREVIYDPTV